MPLPSFPLIWKCELCSEDFDCIYCLVAHRIKEHNICCVNIEKSDDSTSNHQDIQKC
jgi:hypothetical protein